MPKISEVPFDEIQIGDRCISAAGNPGKVIAKYPEGFTDGHLARFDELSFEWDNGNTSEHVFHNRALKIEYLGTKTAKMRFLNLPATMPNMRKGHWFSNFEVHPETKEFHVYIGYENGDSGIIEELAKDQDFNVAFEKCMNALEAELKKHYQIEL